VQLLGRRVEKRSLDALVDGARGGRSSALLMYGEAGIGKSALLDHAREYAEGAGLRVERVCGMESERQFAYAALHELCAPLLGSAPALAEPQRTALNVVFGRESGPAPDRFLVGLAVLNLVAESSAARPLLLVVDDAQWLDPVSAEIIAFLARRLSAERAALLIAVRHTSVGPTPRFEGIPTMELGGLAESDARDLLSSAVLTPSDASTRRRILAEARGNPLALLELPRGLTTAQVASGFEQSAVGGTPGRVEAGFRRRYAGLRAGSRLLLLIAAADPTGDASLLWRAAARLGLGADDAAAAESAGLITIGRDVRFRHPLARSAVYGSAPPDDRRRAHHALGVSIDPRVDRDRRAWHRGQSVATTDDAIAAELDRSAERALARGGMAASAALRQRAADLTADPGLRAERAVAAAQAMHEAGSADDALRLLAVAASGPLDPPQSARVTLYRAMIAFHLSQDHDAPERLLDAARELAPLEPAVSRETYLVALNASIIAGSGDAGTRSIASAARAAPAPPVSARPLDHLLDGLVTTYERGIRNGVGALRHALAAFREREPSHGGSPDEASDRWLPLASRTAIALFDGELMLELTRRNVERARDAGSVAALYPALVALASASVLRGDLDTAARLSAEGDEVARATRAATLPYATHLLAAWRGSAGSGTIDEPEPSNGTRSASAAHATAVLLNGTGDYAGALVAAGRAAASDELAIAALALPELLEAATRVGDAARAADASERIALRAKAGGAAWAHGLAALGRALVAEEDADADYRTAIEYLETAGMSGYLARAHLLHGEHLRRRGHRQRARERLRTAQEMFDHMGAGAFARRAARELRASGAQPGAGGATRSSPLTEHESLIARLVADGATSREVAAHLFLSPRTIDAHLRSIFRKLGITSRRQLRDIRLP